MDLDLKDKLVLITGSCSGIGKETAKAFLAEGAKVIVNGITDLEVNECQKELSGYGVVYGCVADLSTSNGSDDLIRFVSSLGSLNVLVNNLGIFSVKDFSEITDEEWINYFNVNVLSAIRMSRYFLPLMLSNNDGSIINISSEAAVKPLPQMIHYSTTKTAILGLTRGMAELTKGTSVRVNSILPGPTWTEGVKNYFEGLADSKGGSLDQIVSNYFKNDEPTSLLQRFIKPHEVADFIIFVSTQKALNGSAFKVEGGIVRSIV